MALTNDQISNLVNQYANDPYGLYMATKQYGLTQQDISSALNQTPEQAANLAKGFQNAALVESMTGTSGNQFDTLYNQLQSGQMTPQQLSAQYSKAPTAPVTPQQTGASNFYSSPSASSPYVQAAQASAQGNLTNAQQATAANRVNQTTPYGSLNYQQTGTDANGNPIWSATQNLSPEFQSLLANLTKNAQSTLGQGFNPNLPSTGINPGQTYYDAIMSRLQPVQAHQSEQLDAQLANQGIMPGSDAYNRAKTQMAQQQNDQLTSAVVGGFNTGLTANNQAYNQAATSYQMPMATLNQFRNATAPNYVNPAQQATVVAPDYLGAYTAQQNYNLGLQNAQNAANANLTSGLLGLGGAMIMNPQAVSNIASGIGSGLTSLGNAASNAYNSLFGG